MTKIISIIFITILTVIAVGFALEVETDTSSPQPAVRPKAKPRALLLKKKRPGGLLRQRNEEPSDPPPLAPEDAPNNIGNDGNSSAELKESTTRSPKSRKSSRSNQQPSRLERRTPPTSTPLPEGCGECNVATCKNIPEKNCYAGLVLDRCSCCMVCGSGEGHRCYNASIENMSYNSEVGMCGTGLACILRKDLDPNEPLEALCECRDRRLVCGNNNQTYLSECQLREATYSNSELSIASWGPCISAPWMPSSVENITVLEGEEASLSCEVKGFPSPIVHWEFLSFGSAAAPKILPGDDSSVVVTVRGGPEQTMSTSWIQIIAVTNERQGTYFCVATNSHGSTRTSALVTIGHQGLSAFHTPETLEN